MHTKRLAATILLAAVMAAGGCEINRSGGGQTAPSQPLPGEPAYGSDYGRPRGGYDRNRGDNSHRDRGYGRDDHDHHDDKDNRGAWSRNDKHDDKRDDHRDNDKRVSRDNHSAIDKSDRAANDAQFIYMAGQDSLGIVVLSRMAAQKAANPKVRAFAGELFKEHDEMNHRMVYLAKQRGYKVSTELTGPQVKQFQAMQKLPAGREFDRAYLDALNANFDGGVGPYRDAARKSDDADIRQFVDRHIGMVRDHQRRSRELAKGLK